MNLAEIFKNRFLNGFAGQGASLMRVLIALGACLMLSLVLDAVYWLRTRKHGFSRRFALSLTGMSLITLSFVLTIESSIVVSLGMIGALSVIRYRMAVKGVLDMLFMVASIVLGIVCGVGLYFVAGPMVALLSAAVLLSGEAPEVKRNKMLALDGRFPYDEAGLNALLKRHARWYRVRTENVRNGDVNLVIELHRVADENALIEALRACGDFHDVSLQVQEGVVD